MFYSRCIIATVVVALVGVGVWVAVGASGAPDLPASTEEISAESVDCTACQGGTAWKMVVPDDPQERAALEQRCRQEWAARNAKLAAEARARAGQWKGCSLVPSALQDNAEDYARQKEAAELLSADQTAPQGRIDFFQFYLSQEDYYHVGWKGKVVNVIDVPGGKKVELLVRPSLETASGHPARTSRTHREIWRIDDSGRLSLEKAEDGGGLGLIIVD